MGLVRAVHRAGDQSLNLRNHVKTGENMFHKVTSDLLMEAMAHTPASRPHLVHKCQQ